jgi:hypothetical protein
MARKRAEAPAQLRFRGSPELVEALAPAGLHGRGAAVLALEVGRKARTEARLPLDLQTEPAGESATWLRFGLPETTPPGSYKGTIQVGDEKFPMVVEVEPSPNLVASPSQFAVQAAPGEEVGVDISIVNAGNVPCEIGRAHAFGLFDVEGLERGIRAALQADIAKGERRVDRLADEVAESHGGLVRVSVQGAGTLQPGELRQLSVGLRLSDRLEPGHTYTGTWPLHNLAYHVEVAVTAPASRARRATTRKERG